MKNIVKKAVKRGFIGLLIGISSVYIIPLIISVIVNDGIFYPVVPQMTAQFSSELEAVKVQFILGAILGVIMGVSSLIWNDNNFEITSNTIKHFIVLLVTLIPVAWICHWIQHTVKHLIMYIIQFIIIYIIIWLIGMIKNFKQIKYINTLLKKK